MDPAVYIESIAVDTTSIMIAMKVAVRVEEAESDAVRGTVTLDGQDYRWSTIQQFEQHGGFAPHQE